MPHRRRTVEWRLGDAASCPSDAEFDIITACRGCSSSDKAGALRDMHRVLKPGGLVGICVWRAVDHSPCHLALAEALRRLVGLRLQHQAPASVT
jgi:ubiquinone/menaquinone biosynthesis C-methylase UbiE